MVVLEKDLERFDVEDLDKVRARASNKDQQNFLRFWVLQGGHETHWRDFDLAKGSDLVSSVVLAVPEGDDLTAMYVGNMLVGKHENVGLDAIPPRAPVDRYVDVLPKAVLFLEKAAEANQILYLHEEPAHYPGLAHVIFSYLSVPLQCDDPDRFAALAFITYETAEETK